MPFVQGHLRGEKLTYTIDTECGHCHQPIQLRVNSDLEYRVERGGPEPLVYAPLLDIQRLEPSIIDGF